MKRTTALLLSILLLVTMVVPAAADTGTTALTLNYTAPEPSFTMTVPADVHLTSDDVNQFKELPMVTISASNLIVGQHSVQVEASWSGFIGFSGEERINFGEDNFGMEYETEADGSNSAFELYKWIYPAVEGGGVGPAHHGDADGPVVTKLLVGVYPGECPYGTYTGTISFTATLLGNEANAGGLTE